MLHENPNYIVIINEDNDGYNVKNKTTGINEYTTTMLPDAMKIAEMLNYHLSNISKGDDTKIQAVKFSELIN
jgi:hypothetical protein